jgi:hypothetical protein
MAASTWSFLEKEVPGFDMKSTCAIHKAPLKAKPKAKTELSRNLQCRFAACEAPLEEVNFASGLCEIHRLHLAERVKILYQSFVESANEAIASMTRYAPPWEESKETFEYRKVQVQLTLNRYNMSCEAFRSHSFQNNALEATLEFPSELVALFFPMEESFLERFREAITMDADAPNKLTMSEYLRIYNRYPEDEGEERYESEHDAQSCVDALDGFKSRIKYYIDLIIDSRGQMKYVTTKTLADGNHIIVGKGEPF